MSANRLLDVTDLKVHFALDEGTVRAVDGVSFHVEEGEIVGVIGESGCGKSVTAQAIMRIVPQPGRIVSGKILLRGDGNGADDLAGLDDRGKRIRGIRGGTISMIFQEPMTSFSPVYTIGNQISEAARIHRGMDKRQARALTAEMLNKVGIPRPSERLDSYPFQLSGGMRQRAMIAMALCTNPRILIADEPTTALDVTIQAQILDLIRSLQQEMGMSVLLISHDLGVIAEMCHRVAVMYLGRIVESGTVQSVFERPSHPYTQALMNSMPKMSRRAGDLSVIRGSVPNPFERVSGCPFHPRCEHIMSGRCDQGRPPDRVLVGENHHAACLLHAPTEAREGGRT
jgi:peptide/nickel transport system ATP-binding protein